MSCFGMDIIFSLLFNSLISVYSQYQIGTSTNNNNKYTYFLSPPVLSMLVL